MIDTALIKDCLRWFRDVPGIELPPDADQVRLIGPEPDAAIPLDEAEDMPVDRTRILLAAAHSLGLGAVLVLALLLWLGWFSPMSYVFLTLVFSLCYGFPAALAVTRPRLAIPEPDTGTAGEQVHGPGADPGALARSLALAAYNSNQARLALHVCLDILLLPLFLSCQEGVAHWAARSYCADRGLDYRDGFRARLSALPLGLLDRLAGPGAVARVIRLL